MTWELICHFPYLQSYRAGSSSCLKSNCEIVYLTRSIRKCQALVDEVGLCSRSYRSHWVPRDTLAPGDWELVSEGLSYIVVEYSCYDTHLRRVGSSALLRAPWVWQIWTIFLYASACLSSLHMSLWLSDNGISSSFWTPILVELRGTIWNPIIEQCVSFVIHTFLQWRRDDSRRTTDLSFERRHRLLLVERDDFNVFGSMGKRYGKVFKLCRTRLQHVHEILPRLAKCVPDHGNRFHGIHNTYQYRKEICMLWTWMRSSEEYNSFGWLKYICITRAFMGKN